MNVWCELEVDVSKDGSCTRGCGNWDTVEVWIQVDVPAMPQIGQTIVLPTTAGWVEAVGHIRARVKDIEFIGAVCVCVCHDRGSWWSEDTFREAERMGFSRTKPGQIEIAERLLER